ncbi:hypothetical protein [Prosthecobacter sp.]|uniref:hypothetical protein n=1 Tax=Prosthecobacter sp. TaxID=1965333 RepID=UPI0037831E5E
MKTLLILCFLTVASAISAFAGELDFSSMENGDRVEITLHSTGCFHNITLWYEIKKSEDTCFFTQYAITWDHSVPAKMVEKKAIGKLNLTQSDITGLDELLRYYRGKKSIGSTTYDLLRVEYYEGGRLIKVEHLDDASGGAALREKPDALSFDTLTARFKP